MRRPHAPATAPHAASAPGLVAALGRGSLTALVVNTVIGSGIFGLPMLVTAKLGAMSPLGYVAAAAGMAVIALCFAEVASRFRQAGGPYLYARVAFGAWAGGQVGWITWLMRISAAAATARIFAGYLGVVWAPANTPAGSVLAISALFGALAWVNLRGVQAGARTSNALTVAKLAPLAVFVLVGMWFVRGATFFHWRPQPGPAAGNWLSAVLLLIFAFGGFDNALFPASEMRDPRRDAPFAVLVGLAIVAVLYFAIQIVFQGTVTAAAAGAQLTAQPLAVAAQAFLGRPGAWLMAAGAMISIWGWFAATTLGTPRLTYAMAEHGDLPRALAAVHPRFRTPYVSILLYVAAGWVLAMVGNFAWNASLSAIARLVTYGMTCAALPVLRRRPGAPAAFRAPAGFTAAMLGILFCVVLATRMGESELLLLAGTSALATGAWVLRRR